MGQYFLAVNTTKKEFLHPHKFGSGMKFQEFTNDPMSLLTGMSHLLAQSSDGVTRDNPDITGRWIGDNVLIVGDYDESKLFDIAYDCYTDISDEVISHICLDPYIDQHLAKRMRWDGTGATPVSAIPQEIA